MTRYVALLRGINVGAAKQVGMADLKNLVVGLGYTDVKTHLRSGNVLLTADRTSADKLAAHPFMALVAVIARMPQQP